MLKLTPHEKINFKGLFKIRGIVGNLNNIFYYKKDVIPFWYHQFGYLPITKYHKILHIIPKSVSRLLEGK